MKSTTRTVEIQGSDRGSYSQAGELVWPVGESEAALAEDDEPLESPDPEVKSPGAQPKSVFGEFSGLARMLGDSCVDLGQGFPNYDPPDFVVQALRDELDGTGKGQVRTRHQYTRTAGHVPLVEVLAERYSGHLGRPLDALKEVAVTVGATNALFLAMQAALSRSPEAREIVALEPFFELYRSQAHGLGADFRSVPLRFDEAKHSFELDIEALASSLGPQTAALIVNTPHNPTGKAFEESELEAIAELVRQHPNILVISDEVYKYMIFDPPPSGLAKAKDMPAGHIHFARLPDMWERTLTVSSAGKTFGITGWQIGWLIGPSSWMEPIQRFMPNLQFCAPTLTQRALCRVLRQAAEPYSGVESYYEWLRQDYARRRASMVEALESAGITTARQVPATRSGTRRMGCSQSSDQAVAKAKPPSKHSFFVKENAIKSALQVRDKVLMECEEPSAMADYDSWKHVVDEYDVQALDDGKSLPVNRTADQHIAMQTRNALEYLTEDPDMLKRLVKKHRMAHDDISACVSHSKTNLGDPGEIFQSRS
eukprot:s2851_g6.t1